MKRWIALLLIAAVLLTSGCTAARQDRLYLYGEFHANDELLQRELALWKDYYAGGMRDLLRRAAVLHGPVSEPLDAGGRRSDPSGGLYRPKGSASYHQNVLDFYRGIKEACPETVFGRRHQYNSTGYRYEAATGAASAGSDAIRSGIPPCQ